MNNDADPKKPHRPRRTWDRNPVQRPHSTPKGGKGFDRHKEKENLRKELEDTNDAEE